MEKYWCVEMEGLVHCMEEWKHIFFGGIKWGYDNF
jgi:hypothetical protein